jgi:hypothetical protein
MIYARPKNAVWVSIILIVLLGFSACGTFRKHENRITKQEAMRIALTDARSKWKDAFPEVIGIQRAKNGNWLVIVERLPGVPGAHSTAEISSRDGTIIGWYGGS